MRFDALGMGAYMGSATRFRSSVRILSAAMCALPVLCACGSGGSSATLAPTNPTPVISMLMPSSAAAASTAFTLSVSGNDFVSTSVVNWNGAALSTSYVDASHLTASVPASDLTTAGTAGITIFNPAPGGGTSSALTFTINAANPIPSISALVPSAAAAGSPGFTLAVAGSDFIAESTVDWNGAALATTYVDASHLTAAVPASDLTTVGGASITVFNTNPGGGTSSSLTFSITALNPVPAISTLTPSSASAGSPAFTLMVAGSDFVSSSTVNWNGLALATIFVDAAHLTAVVPASDLTTVGMATVTVMNPAPGGGTSSVLAFTITASNPRPSLSTLSPSGAAAGGAAFTLIMTGSDFVPSSTVNWNGVALMSSFVDAAHLTAAVPASELASAGTVSVTVVNPSPGGGTSNALSFTINTSNPAPSIASLSPSSAAVGGAAFLLTVTGSNFVASSTVKWNGVALAGSYVDAAHLTATVPASDLASAGTASVTVVNPSPGGGTSNALSFTINTSNPAPSIASLSPSSAAVGGAAFSLTVTGSNFVAASTVNWNGAALAGSFVDASHLTAMVPASDLVTAGTASITVINPAPGGGTSNALNFTINTSNPAPSIASLSPSSAAAGGAAFLLTVTGGNFVAASTVTWNGVVLVSSFVDSAHLTAMVPASDLVTAGTASIAVINPAPGGGTSNALGFTINASASPSVLQSAQYIGYPGANSNAWKVTLNNVQAGSTIYVVGTWPNFADKYPTMAVTDTGLNTYFLLDRHDDLTNFNLGIQGTQSMGHWYAANVKAGNYTINMSPSPATFEDWVAVAAFEIAGVSPSPIDGHALNFQSSVAPGSNTVTATAANGNSTGILVAVTFDDIDSTAPTVPLAGSGFNDLGPLWDFTQTGKSAARAEFEFISSSGTQTATFSPQEGGQQSPNYMTAVAIFH
jgi:hypothetical protein